jgi:hypothetical protein
MIAQQSTLVEFYNWYIRGHLALEFQTYFGAGPCRELGIPHRVGAICSGEETAAKAEAAAKARRPVYVSMAATTPSAEYKALDRICIDLDAPGELGELSKALRAQLRPWQWAEFTGMKGYRVCAKLPRLLPIYAISPRVLQQMQLIMAGELSKWLDKGTAGDFKRLFRLPYTPHQKTGRLARVVDERLRPLGPKDALAYLQSLKPAPIELIDAAKRAAGRQIAAMPRPRPRPGPIRHIGFSIEGVEGVIRQVLEKKGWDKLQDGRKRLAPVYGCACAFSGLTLEECEARFNELVEDAAAYYKQLERHYRKCLDRKAQGMGPLFSAKKLCEDVAVWYGVGEIC